MKKYISFDDEAISWQIIWFVLIWTTLSQMQCYFNEKYRDVHVHIQIHTYLRTNSLPHRSKTSSFLSPPCSMAIYRAGFYSLQFFNDRRPREGKKWKTEKSNTRTHSHSKCTTRTAQWCAVVAMAVVTQKQPKKTRS